MALNPLYIANSQFCYFVDNEEYIGGDADIFDINRNKSDIIFEMLSYINEGEYGLVEKYGLVAIYNEHESNNENYQFIKIYKYNKNYKDFEDYKKYGTKTKGFGFIKLRLV